MPERALQRSSSRETNGFTLIELLVVISVISLMIALLLPALQGARRSAYNLRCANHVRQQGIAIFSYMLEHNDHGLWGLAAHMHYMGGTVQGGALLNYTSNSKIFTHPDYRFQDGSLPTDYDALARSPTHGNYGHRFPRPRSGGDPATGWLAGDARLFAHRGYQDVLYLQHRDTAGWSLIAGANRIDRVRGRTWLVGCMQVDTTNASWGQMNHLTPDGIPDGGNLLWADGAVNFSDRVIVFFGNRYITVPND